MAAEAGDKCKDITAEQLCKYFRQWAKEMDKWGNKVRDDIVALEKAVNKIEKECCKGEPTKFAKSDRPGDPGPPPKLPW